MRNLSAAVFTLALVACSDTTNPDGAGGQTDGATQASTTRAATSDAAATTIATSAASSTTGAVPCTRNEVPLTVTFTDEGFVDAQVVPVTFDGVEGWLALDTGAGITFVFGEEGDPEYVEHVGDAQVGCETVPMALLTLEAIGVEMFQGKPILGILGLDFFTARPAEVDYPGGKVVRYVSEAPDTRGLVAVPGDYVGGRIVLDAALDAVPMRLMFDTGSPHTIHVGAMAAPGDEEVQLGTADGAVTTVYEGPAALALGTNAPRPITVWRAPTFPYVEEELVELDAAGLLGASGLGVRRMLFDRAGSALWLGPLASP